MALTRQSLFLYGFQITELNSSLDFKASFGGPVKLATLELGFYSLTGLSNEIARAMNAADTANNYSVTINRNVMGGLQNRVTINTSGGYLDLLFSTGPRATSSVHGLIGFNSTDYTGSTSYMGSGSAGTVLIPDYVGYGFLGPEFDRKVFGQVNVSASGLKEAVVFQIQAFTKIEFKYETKTKVISEWEPFMSWAIRQRPFDFTPDISEPDTVYDVTLEKTAAEGRGLGYRMTEMLPQFPNLYRTGEIQMRLNAETNLFL